MSDLVQDMTIKTHDFKAKSRVFYKNIIFLVIKLMFLGWFAVCVFFIIWVKKLSRF